MTGKTADTINIHPFLTLKNLRQVISEFDRCERGLAELLLKEREAEMTLMIYQSGVDYWTKQRELAVQDLKRQYDEAKSVQVEPLKKWVANASRSRP